LQQVLELLRGGFFSPDDRARYAPLVDGLCSRDPYMLCADFDAYAACQARADAVFRKPAEWYRQVVRNVALAGPFSSDRTIRQYAEEIWGAKAVQISLDAPRAPGSAGAAP
jgi:starch phosphorylase